MLLFRWLIKFEGFDPDNILIDEKSYEKNLVYKMTYKNFIAAKPLLDLMKQMDLLEFMMELDI